MTEALKRPLGYLGNGRGISAPTAVGGYRALA